MTDDEAFESMYAAHYEDLLRYALRRCDDPADAADVVAEAWVVAWRRRAELPGVDERRLWLFGVARRVLANQRRGQLRRSRLADRLREELVLSRAADSAAGGRVLSALRRLPAADRDLLAMSVWEGLTAAEIAVVVACSAPTVRVRLHRARRRLRAALDEQQPARVPHVPTLTEDPL